MKDFTLMYSIFLISLLLISFYLIHRVNKKINIISNKLTNTSKYLNFEKYETLLSLYMDKSYVTIYKDHILVYSVDGLSPDEDDILKIQKLYIELLLTLLGPNLVNEYLDYFGSYDTLFKNAILYFDEKYESDSIKKSAIDKQLKSFDE